MSVETGHRPAESEERLRFEALIAELSSRFVNVPAAEVDHQIMDAQRHICELLGLDFSALWQWSHEPPGGFTLTHFYSAVAGPQTPPQMRQDQYPWAREQLLAGRTIAISSREELPPEAARDRETLGQFGIKSNLALPLSVGGEPLVGILGLGTIRVHRDWPDAVVKRLQLLAQVFANALARKHAELTLRDSAERLSLTTDSAEVGLWILDSSTRVFWATEKARAIFGYSADEAITMERFRASVHPEDWHLVQGSLERCMQGGEPLNVEYRIRLDDGRTRWIASRGRPHLAPAGEPRRLMGVSLDITERKLVEESRRISEARLEAGSDLLGLGYYEVDYGAHTCFLDDRFRQICGVPAEIKRGLEPVQFWQEHVHPVDRQTLQDIRQKLHGGLADRISTEYRYLHPAQGQRWLHHSARVARRGAGGSEIRTFGVIRDITEQKRVAEQQAEDLRFVTLIARLSSRFVHLPASDIDREILGALRSICEALRLDFTAVWQWSNEGPGRFVATHCYNALQGPQPPPNLKHEDYPWLGRQLLAGRLSAFASLEDFPPEAALDRENCRRLGIKSHLSLPLAMGGEPTFGILGLNTVREERDWPDELVKRMQIVGQILANALIRKRADEEMLRLRLGLWHAGRVAQTGAITGSLAHELNQPLTGILSTAQAGLRFIASGHSDLALLQEILTNIVHDTKRAGAVINGLRVMLRNKETQRESISLAETIHEVFALLHSELLARQVEHGLRLESDAWVVADRAQLQQVLLNLLMNALEAMEDQPPGGRRVELTVTQTNNGDALVSVRDSGPGIPQDHQAKIFTAFWTTKPQGMGIGLAISYSIVESHGGRLWCANHPDGGAVFYFSLPIERGEGRGARGSVQGSGVGVQGSGGNV